MQAKGNSGEFKTRSATSILLVVGICGFFYILGAWQRSGFGNGDRIATEITRQTDCSVLPNLNYETHHGVDSVTTPAKEFIQCKDEYIDYTPCQDQMRAMKFPRENMMYRERHCPLEEDKLDCLIPAPKGYAIPFPWPKSRDYVPFANAPYKNLTVEKAVQNWIQHEGNVFRFPGGGTQFPHGADAYIKELSAMIPMDHGLVRTALDIGCGVASLGAYLFKKNVITMSFAPRDSHEAQVQFALERGVLAVIGVLGTIKMPYPSRAFDMVHCSRCLILWSENDGIYMMEVDRVLRPGGYFVLSGPPINWRDGYRLWKRPREDLEGEQKKIEETAKLLCWEKRHEIGEIAVWQKNINYDSCSQEDIKLTTCESNPDDVWYKEMEACVTPYPETNERNEVAGGKWKRFPERLDDVPFKISSRSIPGITAEIFEDDARLWRKHVNAYKRVNNIIDSGRYRNIMDMNSGLGSFAAALESPKLWVMNVMPTIAERDTLGVIYERGLIGIYHDWCEAFSTYPRTYDLIHANSVFSLYENKCSDENILLEMDRILRPEGAVIIRDQVNVLIRVKKITGGMRWKTKLVDHEDGPLVSEKILFAVKTYWVVGENNTTSGAMSG